MQELKNIKLADTELGTLNHRTIFEKEIGVELVLSIRQNGIIQAVVVRPHPTKKGRYELVAGERRFRGALIVEKDVANPKYKNEEWAKLDIDRATIPAMVRDLTDDQVIELQITENIQRANVHPMEEASAYASLRTRFIGNGMEGPDALREVAKRVAKAASYVAQRIRLTEIIAEYQKAFFKNQITMNQVFLLFRLSDKAQKEMWKKHHCDEKGTFKIEEWQVNELIGNLKDAAFDTSDSDLKTDMGPCTTCPHNSGSNVLLFPDENGLGTCGLVACFVDKSNLAYERALEAALIDPDTVLVSNTVGTKSQELTKAGHEVLREYTHFNELRAPEVEELNRTDYASDKQYKDAVSAAKKAYDAEVLAWEKEIKKGKYLKGFVVEGGQRGHTIWIERCKGRSTADTTKPQTAAQFEEKVESGNVTAQDIADRMEVIRSKEKRNKELDEERIAPEVFALLSKNKQFNTNAAELSIYERVALLILLIDYASEPTRRKMYRTIGIKATEYTYANLYRTLESAKATSVDRWINSATRLLILDKMCPTTGMGATSHGMTAIVEQVAGSYQASEVKKIRGAQMEIRTTREKKVEQRLQELGKQKAELKPTPKKKKTK